MEKQEIDNLLARCKQITEAFRSSLKPAVDETGQVRMVDEIIERGKKTGKKKQLWETTSKQVQEYINKIQEIWNDEVQHRITGYYPQIKIIDCSYLYISGEITLKGSLPFCNFFNSTFLNKSNFRSTNFSGSTDFNYVTFSDNADFIGATFFGNTYFNNVVFSDYVVFKNANFHNLTYFDNTTFWGETGFTKAIFSSYPTFSKSIFHNSAYFTNAIFYYNATFNGAIFTKRTDFNNVVFSLADFSNTKFQDTANFENTIFKIPPKFHNAEFHPGTSFGQPEDIERHFVRHETQDDYIAYRTLKQQMNKIHARLEESIFFALEQKTKLHIDRKEYEKTGDRKILFNIWISRFYHWFSDYGQDTLRPFVWLLAIWLVFGIVFSFPHLVMMNPPDKIPAMVWFSSINKESLEWTNPEIGLMYSFQNIFNPASLFGKDNLFMAGNIIILLLAYIEFLFAVSLATLWLLAVRNRFQKGS